MVWHLVEHLAARLGAHLRCRRHSPSRAWAWCRTPLSPLASQRPCRPPHAGGCAPLGMKTDGIFPVPNRPFFHIWPARFRIFGKIWKWYGIRDGGFRKRERCFSVRIFGIPYLAGILPDFNQPHETLYHPAATRWPSGGDACYSLLLCVVGACVLWVGDDRCSFYFF